MDGQTCRQTYMPQKGMRTERLMYRRTQGEIDTWKGGKIVDWIEVDADGYMVCMYIYSYIHVYISVSVHGCTWMAVRKRSQDV